MQKVKSNELEQYAKTFAESLLESANANLSPNEIKYSRYGRYLPAHIDCVVSTQNGMALIYHPAEQMTYSHRYDSKRIEELVFPVPRAYLKKKKVAFEISGENCKITSCKVSGMAPLRLKGENASVSFEDFLWESKIGKFSKIKFAEIFSSRNPSLFTREVGIKKGMEEVLKIMSHKVLRTYALTQISSIRNINLSEVISKYKEKAVLILGKDSTEESYSRLQKIAQVISDNNFWPIIMKNIPDDTYQDLNEKVATLGSICRFSLVDDTEASGHLEELEILPQLGCVIGLLQPKGRPSSFMHATLSSKYRWVVKQEYESDNFEEKILDLLNICEQTFTKKSQDLEREYKW